MTKVEIVKIPKRRIINKIIINTESGPSPCGKVTHESRKPIKRISFSTNRSIIILRNEIWARKFSDIESHGYQRCNTWIWIMAMASKGRTFTAIISSLVFPLQYGNYFLSACFYQCKSAEQKLFIWWHCGFMVPIANSKHHSSGWTVTWWLRLVGLGIEDNPLLLQKITDIGCFRHIEMSKNCWTSTIAVFNNKLWIFPSSINTINLVLLTGYQKVFQALVESEGNFLTARVGIQWHD